MNNLTIEMLEKGDWYKCNSVDAGEAMAMVTSQLIATMKALEVARDFIGTCEFKGTTWRSGEETEYHFNPRKLVQAVDAIKDILGAKP
jgi:hypothetical protein